MHEESLTAKQGISLVSLFVMGSTLIIGTGGGAKNDMWMAILLALLLVFPLLWVYSRLLELHPGEDLYGIGIRLFGRILGRIFAIVYIWYAFHLGALVIRNFGEFIHTVAFPETPMMISMLMLGLTAARLVYSGLQVMGSSGKLLLILIMIVIVVVQLLVITELRFLNFKPMFYHGVMPVLKGGFSTFSFPFAESVLFLMVLHQAAGKARVFKVFWTGILIGGLTIFVLGIRNLLVLGSDLLNKLYFPSYVAVSRIDVGEFLQRVEVSVAIVFVVAALFKVGICLYAVCRGLEKVLGLQTYKSSITHTSLLMVFFAEILYDNIMEMREWAFQVYAYYALPFQVVLPVLIWGYAEYRHRKSI